MKKEKRKKITINLISGFLFLFSIAIIGYVGYSLVDKYLENRELSQIRDSKREEKALEDILVGSDYDIFETDIEGESDNLVEFPTK